MPGSRTSPSSISSSPQNDRPRRDLLARAEQAPPHDDHRLRKMVVYDDSERSRFESSTPASDAGPGDLRRVPAHLPHRRHRLAAVDAAEPLCLEMEISARDPHWRQRPARLDGSASRSCE